MKKTASALFLSVGVLLALSVTRANAESPAVQKAFENVKESLDTLIGTKDEKTGDELALRIETYRKVLQLSVAETKDLKMKLLSIDWLDDDPQATAWKKEVLETLGDSLAYYDEQNALLDTEEQSADLKRIKEIAEQFKAWREGKYLAAASQIRELVMIEQGSETLNLASRRYQKVAEDVEKIRKARIRGSDALPPLLEEAGVSLAEGRRLNEAAAALFHDRYFPILTEGTSTQIEGGEGATSTATSTLENTTSTEGTAMPSEASTVSTTPRELSPQESTSTPTAPSEHSTTSTPESETSLSTSTPPLTPLPPSLRDLVRESLVKTRDAYRVFIEMSNLVRKLLA